MRQAFSRALVALILGLGAAPAQAKLRALVVGVSSYSDPRLAGSALPGAAEDARAVAAALIGRGAAAEDVATLVGAEATAAGIVSGLDRLEGGAAAGDRIVIYLSGHGAQVPAPASAVEEPDGLDEVFLAADAASWEAHARRLPGSVKDDRFGRALDAIRARGASAWFVVDACNGGGLQRGGELKARPRLIDPMLLGLPAPMRGGRADASGLADARPVPGGGKLVAFYAAPPGAVAWERALPTASGSAPRGLFTWSLLQALAKAPSGADFLSLAGAVDKARLALGPPSTAPLVAGDLAELVLFDGTPRDLLGFARAAPPLPADARVAIGRSEPACAGAEPEASQAQAITQPLRLSGCRKILVELRSSGPALAVQPWYRDAGGAYVALADANGVRVPPGGSVSFRFTFTDHDPASGAALPSGTEYLIMLAENGSGASVIDLAAGP